MPPLWPFGKKKQPLSLDEEAPAPIMYRKTDETEEKQEQSKQQQEDYKAALSFFGSGDATVHRAEEQSQRYDGLVASADTLVETKQPQEGEITWIHHTDGYHYKRRADGTFDPVAHTKNSEGVYQPYA